jgi:hypothetical protein
VKGLIFKDKLSGGSTSWELKLIVESQDLSQMKISTVKEKDADKIPLNNPEGDFDQLYF